MAKNVAKQIKLQIPAGKATPAPPVGTVLGPAGINLGEFCTKFNDATKDKMGDVLPVEISVYEDRTFDFVIKTPPVPFLIKKYAHVASMKEIKSNDYNCNINKYIDSFEFEEPVDIIVADDTDREIPVCGYAGTDAAPV